MSYQIVIGEGDGILYEDGIPRNVIVSVVFENKKTVSLPYLAGKTISALFSDIKSVEARLRGQASSDAPASRPGLTTRQLPPPAPPQPETGLIPTGDPNRIEREDIVKCILTLEEARVEGTDLEMIPQVGKEYRVVSVHMKEGKVTGYDVIDDSNPIPSRMPIYPQEVALVRKAPPREPPVREFEETIECPDCHEVNVLVKNEDNTAYVGICTKCQRPLSREIVDNGSAQAT